MDALWSRDWFAFLCLLVAAALIFRLLYRRKLRAVSIPGCSLFKSPLRGPASIGSLSVAPPACRP